MPLKLSFIQWIKRIWKKKNSSEFNIHHPELADKIEHAFTVDGVKYYRFADEFRMPTGRYKWVMNYLREVDLRMDLGMMKAYMNELLASLNGKKGMIDILTAGRIIHSIQTRLELAFEPESVKRLASVTYFDDTEDLSDFDPRKGEQKIKTWEKHKFLDFFLTKPISELLMLNGTSVGSLEAYIKEAQEIIKGIYEPSIQSPENISKNGTSTS